MTVAARGESPASHRGPSKAKPKPRSALARRERENTGSIRPIVDNAPRCPWWDAAPAECSETFTTAGWTAVAFLPWTGFQSLPSAESIALPPADRWRFNVFRIKRPGGERRPTQDVFAAWSPPTGASFHEPAVFRDLVFDAAPPTADR